MSGVLPLAIRPPARLLVRGVNWLGDAVMTTPALMRLRERFPTAHIALLSSARLSELWREHPALDEVLSFRPGENPFSVAARVRTGEFDTALVLPNSPRAALEMWLARIPCRIGYAARWRRWWLTHALPPRPGHVAMRKRSVREIKRLIALGDGDQPASRSGQEATAHQMHDYLHLAAALGATAQPLAPQLVVSEAEVSAVKARFGLEFERGPILALHPGAEYGPAKRWPVERFVAVAQQVQRQTGCLWLVIGGPAERALAAEVAAGIGGGAAAVRDVAGRTSLRELMALLKSVRLLLGNDTGPMHVAAALGTPVVAVFGSTSPELTGPGLPGRTSARVLRVPVSCAPCFRRRCPVDFRCMRSLEVAEVVQAVLAGLGG